jgi:hypothetical protein
MKKQKTKLVNQRKAQLLGTLGSQDARTLDRAELAKVAGGSCGFWPEPCTSRYCGSCGSGGDGRDY